MSNVVNANNSGFKVFRITYEDDKIYLQSVHSFQGNFLKTYYINYIHINLCYKYMYALLYYRENTKLLHHNIGY